MHIATTKKDTLGFVLVNLARQIVCFLQRAVSLDKILPFKSSVVSLEQGCETNL